MEKNKKTCFIISTLNAGGRENNLCRYLNYLPNTENITVIVKSGKKGDLYDDYIKTGVKIRFQSVGYLNFKKISRLYQFFKSEKFETVCDFCGNFSGISLSVARMAKVKTRIAFFVRSTHAFKLTSANLLYASFSNKLIKANATKIISNSKAALDFFFPDRKENDSRYKILSNAVNAASFDSKYNKNQAREIINLPKDAYVIGHVGRFDPAKNHETIFKVIEIVLKEFNEVVFVFCGNDTDSEDFKARANAISKDKIVTLGTRKDIDVVLRSMDVFYFPSVTEGQPNALIEAALAGLPIITSNIPPIKEIIPQHAQKYLIPPLDFNAAVEQIRQLKEGIINPSEIIYKEKMINDFDASNNFKLFQNEL